MMFVYYNGTNKGFTHLEPSTASLLHASDSLSARPPAKHRFFEFCSPAIEPSPPRGANTQESMMILLRWQESTKQAPKAYTLIADKADLRRNISVDSMRKPPEDVPLTM